MISTLVESFNANALCASASSAILSLRLASQETIVAETNKMKIYFFTFLIFCEVMRFDYNLQRTVFIGLLMYFIFGTKLFIDIIQKAVDKLAALYCAVSFCQVDIFINGNLGRYCFEE